jgi:hypothetical protein
VASQIFLFLRDTHVLPKLLSYEKNCRRYRWWAHRRSIAVHLRCKWLYSSFTTMEETEKCYAFILFRTPHETIVTLKAGNLLFSFISDIKGLQQSIWLENITYQLAVSTGAQLIEMNINSSPYETMKWSSWVSLMCYVFETLVCCGYHYNNHNIV